MKTLIKYKAKGQRGFTLVELVVVIAIIGVLSAVAVPFIASHLGESKDRAYEVDRERFQQAVDAFYSRPANLHYLGKPQYPIMGMDKVTRKFVKENHNHSNENHLEHTKNHQQPGKHEHTVILNPLGNPLGGTQGGSPRWIDGPFPEGNGIRDGGEEELLDNDEESLDKPGWHVATVNRQGTRYIVDSRDYFIDFTKLSAMGLLEEVPSSASTDNKPKDPPHAIPLVSSNAKAGGLTITPPTSPVGVALWVVNEGSEGNPRRVFQYSVEGEPLDGGFTLDGANNNAVGITTNGTSLWVLDRRPDGKVFRYNLDGTGPVVSFDLDVPSNNSLGHLVGITTDGTNLWVLDQNDGVFRYRTDGTFRNEFFELHPDNINAEGITTDGTSLWVSDDTGGSTKGQVFRYTLSGELLSSFSVGPAAQPHGIATDGTNIWVVDRSTDTLYPFGLDGGPPGPEITGQYTGSYSWYVDPDGKVKSLYFYLPEPDSIGFQAAYP